MSKNLSQSLGTPAAVFTGLVNDCELHSLKSILLHAGPEEAQARQPNLQCTYTSVYSMHMISSQQGGYLLERNIISAIYEAARPLS